MSGAFRVGLFVLAWLAVLGAQVLNAAEGDAKWDYPTTGAVFGSPAVASDGSIYFGSRDGKVYSLNGDGTFRWSTQTSDWVDSSPTLSQDESVVYVGSWDNRMYALSSSTGQKLWEFETGSLIAASPALDPYGNLFFGSSDGFLYSLTKDGELRWSFYVGEELDSSPAVDEIGNVYVGAYDGILYAFTNAGRLRWEFEIRATADAADHRIKAPPTVDDFGNVLFGGGDGYLYALDSAGNKLWDFQAGEPIDTGVAIDESGNYVFGSRNGLVFSVDDLGVLNWESYVGDVFYSTPALDDKGRVYIGSYLGNGVSGVTVLDGAGAFVLEYLLLDYIDSSPVIDGAGQAIFGCYDGSLYAFEVDAALSGGGWSRFGADAGNRSLRMAAEPQALTAKFGVWLEERRLSGEASNPCIDLDGDGLALLLEYYFGTDPGVPDGSQVEHGLVKQDGELKVYFEYTRVAADQELRARLERSAALSAWEESAGSGQSYEQVVVEVDVFGDGEYERVRLYLGAEQPLPDFFRIALDCE